MGVGHAPVIDRHAEESGGAERFGIGRHLFDVAPERFLARVDASDQLKAGGVYPSRFALRIRGNRIERTA